MSDQKPEVGMFLVGDRAMFHQQPHDKKLATIIRVVKAKGIDEMILVEFDEEIENGHDGVTGMKPKEIKERRLGKFKGGKDKHCWWCYTNQLRRTEENIDKSITRFKKGDEVKIIAKRLKPLHGFNTGERVGVIEHRDQGVRVVGIESKRSKAYNQFVNAKELELVIPKRKVTKIKFLARDIVKAKAKAKYAITTKGWEGKVLATAEDTKDPIFLQDETIRVQGKNNMIFYVNHMDFTLLKRPAKRKPRVKKVAKPSKKTPPLKTKKPSKEVR